MSKPGFVIGNGRSRLGLDLRDLAKHGKTYGCNALYRDFTPDVLIATDPGITAEIESCGYPRQHAFYTRDPSPDSGSLRIEHHWGFSSGPVALKHAALAGHQVIYLLGFDLNGISGLHNNVYSGTQNYKESGDSETYYGNWINQIEQIMSEHPDQMFIRLIDQEAMVPHRWLSKPNYRNQLIGDFLPSINSSPWQRLNESVINTR